jgi:hypothetical protein
MRCYESAVLYDQSKLEEMKKAENVDETFLRGADPGV